MIKICTILKSEIHWYIFLPINVLAWKFHLHVCIKVYFIGEGLLSRPIYWYNIQTFFWSSESFLKICQLKKNNLGWASLCLMLHPICKVKWLNGNAQVKVPQKVTAQCNWQVFVFFLLVYEASFLSGDKNQHRNPPPTAHKTTQVFSALRWSHKRCSPVLLWKMWNPVFFRLDLIVGYGHLKLCCTHLVWGWFF